MGLTSQGVVNGPKGCCFGSVRGPEGTEGLRLFSAFFVASLMPKS